MRIPFHKALGWLCPRLFPDMWPGELTAEEAAGARRAADIEEIASRANLLAGEKDRTIRELHGEGTVWLFHHVTVTEDGVDTGELWRAFKSILKPSSSPPPAQPVADCSPWSDWFARRVAEWPVGKLPPSREDDERAAKAEFPDRRVP
ncbi:MAG: hypothetical protein ACJ8H8_31620, partial [Geminicoccaceae bacterium]